MGECTMKRYREKRLYVHISELKCRFCGTKMFVPRPGRPREYNHKKTMYCPKCRRLTIHIEKRYKDF